MSTVLDLIIASMQDIGAIALGETPTDSEADSVFSALNDMVETWNTESLMIYNVTPHTFAYVAGQKAYTMGTGGNFNVPRPVKIEAAYNRLNSGQTSQTDIPIAVTDSFSEYADILTKEIQTTLPTIMYDDGGFPLKTLYFWPVPQDVTYTPVLWYWTAITAFAATNETISLPPGYKRALQKNLAIEIAPAFERAPSNLLISQAVESKAQIKRINYTVDELQMPSGIPGSVHPLGLAQFLSGYP